MSGLLYEQVKLDLLRPHDFAHERVGFLFGKFVERGTRSSLVLFARYETVGDECYSPSEEFGALIGPEPILSTMQALRNLRGSAECAFHVHMHFHKGRPGLSRADRKGLPPLIPGFQRMSPDGCHGLLILSEDHGLAWTWKPGQIAPDIASRIVIAGAPLQVYPAGECTNA